MTGALPWAVIGGARRATPAGGAYAGAVEARAVAIARRRAGAALEATVVARVALRAFTVEVDALALGRPAAVARARADTAVVAKVARVAVAGPIVTVAVARTVVLARPERAIVARPSRVAGAPPVRTHSVAGAVIGAEHDRAVVAGKALGAGTLAEDALAAGGALWKEVGEYFVNKMRAGEKQESVCESLKQALTLFGHDAAREQSGGRKPAAQRQRPSSQTPLAPLQSFGQRASGRTVRGSSPRIRSRMVYPKGSVYKDYSIVLFVTAVFFYDFFVR